ncbi:c-type cytochrome [Pseudomonas jilinensis]|uniref:Cytochrome C n=1 Tax=Pseudomonas jilinensis TaxID=2078689 RepID=A0A396SAP5_9PSED|nr:cytochrome c [Pseudomonas jilinensis]RHW20535.1 cytochrome C [Pseudomonas jilinensis]
MKSVIVTLLGGAVLAASLSAVAQVAPEDQIKFRKAGYSYMSWNMGKIKAQVIDGAVEYNQQQVLAAATTIDAIANSGMGALYGSGTEQNVGNQTTRANPELFNNFPDVAELSGNLNQATANLVAAAQADDQGQIRAAFGQVGQACKACHDKYRMD